MSPEAEAAVEVALEFEFEFEVEAEFEVEVEVASEAVVMSRQGMAWEWTQLFQVLGGCLPGVALEAGL